MEKEFSLQYVFSIIKKWRRPLLAFMVLGTLAGGLATLALPKLYLSTATVVPANPILNDKNYLFGDHVQEPRSVYGMEEDLDRLLTTATLDGNFYFLADSFRLPQHYDLSGKPEKARTAAFKKLKRNSSIVKTATGAVEVSVWDTDRELAAAMANALVYRTESLNRMNNNAANAAFAAELQSTLQRQDREYEAMSTELKSMSPSAAYDLKEAQRRSLLMNMERNMTLVSQLQTASLAKSPGLLVLEKATPGTSADKPRLGWWIAAGFFSSTLFALLLAIVLETYKRK